MAPCAWLRGELFAVSGHGIAPDRAGQGRTGLSRGNLYKMHKGVFGENVQNSKINPQKPESLHAAVRAIKEGA